MLADFRIYPKWYKFLAFQSDGGLCDHLYTKNTEFQSSNFNFHAFVLYIQRAKALVEEKTVNLGTSYTCTLIVRLKKGSKLRLL